MSVSTESKSANGGVENQVEIESWMHDIAAEHATNLDRSEGDGGDGGREYIDKVRDNYYSIIAELVFQKYAEESGLDAEYVADWKGEDEVETNLESGSDLCRFDIDVAGARVDVKMRKTWEYSEPDLLIRADWDGTLHSQIYTQVDLERSSTELVDLEDSETVKKATNAAVVGFATDFNAESGEHFLPNSIGKYHPIDNPSGYEYFKILVEREELHDIKDIEVFAQMVRVQYESRGGDLTIANRDDFKQFCEKIRWNKRDAEQRGC